MERQIIQGEGSTYNEINHHLISSLDYQKLVSDIDREKRILQLIPESEIEERIITSEKISILEKSLDKLKADVFRLYEFFNTIPIDSERLKIAKRHFNSGEFIEADRILESKIISEEIDTLIQLKIKHEEDIKKIDASLVEKANEFIIKAKLWMTFYNQPDWFDKTKLYFENALVAARSVPILVEYAEFLQDHNQHEDAQLFFEEALEMCNESKEGKSQNEISKAGILFCLANILKDKHQYNQAEDFYKRSINIYGSSVSNDHSNLNDLTNAMIGLANLYSLNKEFEKAENLYQDVLKKYDNSKVDILSIANILTNIGNIYSIKNNYVEARKYFIRSLTLKEILATTRKKYFFDIALTHNNLGLCELSAKNYCKAKFYFDRAIKVLRDLANENPNKYLPEVANTLNNISFLQIEDFDVEHAQQSIEESISIYRVLIKNNSHTYLSRLALALINYGRIMRSKGNIDSSILCYEESIKIYTDIDVDENLLDLSNAYNNLAVSQVYSGLYIHAENNYIKALKIRRKLADSVPEAFLSHVIKTLNNLGNLKLKSGSFFEANKFLDEAVALSHNISKFDFNQFLDYAALSLTSIANLNVVKGDFIKANDAFIKAIDYRRQLVKLNPFFVPDLIFLLYNYSSFKLDIINDKILAKSIAEEAFSLISEEVRGYPGIRDVEVTLNEILS